MVMHTMKRLGIFCLFAALVPCQAGADEGDTGQRQPEGRGKPPQAAYDACKGKSEGTAVKVSTPRGTMKAVCRSMEGELVAVPEGAPPRPPRDGGGERE